MEKILVDKLFALFDNFGKAYSKDIIKECLKRTAKNGISMKDVTNIVLNSIDPDTVYIHCREITGRSTKGEEDKFIENMEDSDIAEPLFSCLAERTKYLGSGSTSLVVAFKTKKFKDMVFKFLHNKYGVLERGLEERERDVKMYKKYPDSFARTEFVILVDDDGDGQPLTMQERLNEEKIYELLEGTKGYDVEEFTKEYLDELPKYAKNPEEFKKMIKENPDIEGFAFDERGFVKAFDYA